MTVTWRPPTGKPAWPTINLSGVDHSGKSWEIAEFSASGIVGMTYVISFGETSSDAYGVIPGAKYLMTEPQTRAQLREAVRDAVKLPRYDPELPNCLALDSASSVWELLGDEAQETANRRARDKAAKFNKDFDPTSDYQVTTDLWNEAKARWYEIMGPLFRYTDGPVIITTKLEFVSIFNAKGDITKEKEWKSQAHKKLPFDTDVSLQFRSRTERILTTVKSATYKMSARGFDVKPADYGIAALLADLGISQETVGNKTRLEPVVEGTMPSDWVQQAEEAELKLDRPAILRLWQLAKEAGDAPAVATLEQVGARIKAAQAAPAQQEPQAEAQSPRPTVSAQSRTESEPQTQGGSQDGGDKPVKDVQPDVTPPPAPEPPADEPPPEQDQEAPRDPARELRDWWANKHGDVPFPEPPDDLTPEQKRSRAQWRTKFTKAKQDGSLKMLKAAVTAANTQKAYDLAAEAEMVLEEETALQAEIAQMHRDAGKAAQQ